MADVHNIGHRRLDVIQGVEAAECGLACMTMIARYYGHDVDLNGMRQRFSLSMAGVTLRSLIALAEQLGFAVRPLRAEIKALGTLRGPIILHWDMNHFVVLKSMHRGKFIVHDPAIGCRKLDAAEFAKHFTGVVLEISPTAQMKPLRTRVRTRLKDLWSHIGGFWSAITQILVLSIALQVAVFAAPFYVQLTVDEALQTGNAELLSVLALGFGGLMVVQIAITALRSWTLQSTGLLVSFHMIGNLVSHLLRLKTTFFEKRHVGDILSRLASVKPVQEAVTQGVVATFIDGFMAIIVAVILFVYSPPLALLVVATVALSLAATYALYPAQHRRMEEQIVASAKEQSHLIESVRASTTIKVMGREAEREGSWRNLFADVTNASFSVGKLSVGITASQGLITGLQTILIVYLAADAILRGQGFSIGMLFAFLSYRQTFTDRCLALINQLIQFSFLRLHLDRVSDIVQAKREPQASSLGAAVEYSGRIATRKLSFKYGSADPLVLDDIHLDIPEKSCVALVGPSGGGKTTLLKLLLGLYDPTCGEVILDGQPARPEVWRNWRLQAGVVAQDDQLLSGTIADNIAFFDPELDMEGVVRVAMAARIHDEILRMPMQYLSLVGDMGSALSGGQRQRILLARALYRKPKVLFLDEGTANLDEETEMQIVELIDSLSITRIIVAHRPALVDIADNVYRVAGGKVVHMPNTLAEVAKRA